LVILSLFVKVIIASHIWWREEHNFRSGQDYDLKTSCVVVVHIGSTEEHGEGKSLEADEAKAAGQATI
jgi:creatinine amidohydrolase/Fe(II)-dependent formamide hydrolase-like protein